MFGLSTTASRTTIKSSTATRILKNSTVPLVRYVWLDISPKSARMERSFSPDGGKTWEGNWICELSR
jgi:hypothetical protein